MRVPSAPDNDPDRGPSSPRHRPWAANGSEPSHFEWVTPQSSLQWHAFQRIIELLRSRGSDVLVVLGPFNEHMIAPESKPGYHALREAITEWLKAKGVSFIAPDALPSELYADASHPLTDGYTRLARQLFGHQEFQAWISHP